MTTEDQIRERVENALMEAAENANGLEVENPDFPRESNITREDEIIQSAIQLALIAMSTRVGDTVRLDAALKNIRHAQSVLLEVEEPTETEEGS